MKKIALIDNYDSFTYNLVHLIEKVSDAKVDVFLNNRVSLNTFSDYQNVIISPGPGLPSCAGITPEFLKAFASTKNILGICLGLQAIAECFHSPLKNLNTVMHGIASPILHFDNDFLFNDIPANFTAGRYHSWVIDKAKMNKNLLITAEDKSGEIMAIKHIKYSVRGVQFHPESILSEYGEVLITNWLDNL